MELLLEIGVEELPAAAVVPALDWLVAATGKLIADAGLGDARVRGYSTPRRLAVHAAGFAPQAPDRVVRTRGPSLRAAYDEAGRPTAALGGFARAQGVGVEALVAEEGPGGAYIYAQRTVLGRTAREVLAEGLGDLVLGVPFARTMRWGTLAVRYARPIRWIVALLDAEPVAITVANVTSGRLTRGRRGEAPLVVSEPGAYVSLLAERGIGVDRDERRHRIVAQGDALAHERALTVDWRTETLDEVVDLVESPHPFLGEFPAEALSLPEAVLVTTMTHHQRYLPVRDARGALAPFFLGVMNHGDEAVVRLGNERVLRARLADARFFYENDRRRPLADRVEDLAAVTFYTGLGSLLARARRLERLTPRVARAMGLTGEELAQAARAGRLAKADQTTDLVRELPELEGIVGARYALESGESEVVAAAIGEQYLPRGPEDDIPASPLGRALAVSDKLDALVGLFSAGREPTGSEDPLGLRRAALGVIRILMEMSPSVAVAELIAAAAETWELGARSGEVAKQVAAFLHTRLEVLLVQRGYRPEVVAAVLAAGADALGEVKARVEALTAFLADPLAMDLAVSHRRAARILRKAPPEGSGGRSGGEPAELELEAALERVEPELRRALAQGDYAAFFRAAAALRAPVDRFFDEVTVMAEEAPVRDFRLSLLRRTVAACSGVADLGRLGGTT